MALGDCYSIALAKLLGVKAYFGKESELERAIERDKSLGVVFV